MKKLLAVSLIALSLTLGSVVAEAQFKGGYKDGVAIISTVKDAKDMNDDAYVTLRGNIEKRIKGDKYLFRDSTGTIEVEIDNNKWHGVEVGPEDLVEIMGEVDKSIMSSEIDVKRVEKIKK